MVWLSIAVVITAVTTAINATLLWRAFNELAVHVRIVMEATDKQWQAINKLRGYPTQQPKERGR